jgi:hypothetical protein
MNPIRRKNSGPICLGYPICSMICFPNYSYNNTTMMHDMQLLLLPPLQCTGVESLTTDTAAAADSIVVTWGWKIEAKARDSRIARASSCATDPHFQTRPNLSSTEAPLESPPAISIPAREAPWTYDESHNSISFHTVHVLSTSPLVLARNVGSCLESTSEVYRRIWKCGIYFFNFFLNILK